RKLTAMGSQDLARHRQPETCPMTLGGEERVKELFYFFLRHPRSRVGNRDDEAFVLAVYFHIDAPSIGHRLARVAHQIEHDLPDLSLIDHRPREIGLNTQAQLQAVPFDLRSHELN